MVDMLRRRARELPDLLSKLHPHVTRLASSMDAGLQSSFLQLLATLMPEASDAQAGESRMTRGQCALAACVIHVS